ncbi:hypothetical protein CLU79DRAFT_837792 [Phycomyces nitens]|nr:hypothetical protein CLU79DRAFT_837792 [Phycomyces nitens]
MVCDPTVQDNPQPSTNTSSTVLPPPQPHPSTDDSTTTGRAKRATVPPARSVTRSQTSPAIPNDPRVPNPVNDNKQSLP